MKNFTSLIFIIFFITYSLKAQSFDETYDSCTTISVGKEATQNGATIITHNDDSSVADFRLWIIPEADWPENARRDIVLYSHDYVDYGKNPPVYPEVDPSGEPVARVVGSMPQVKHTYRYLHSRYSFMNEKGVAMGETTITIDTSNDYGKEVERVMIDESEGIIDCWFAQDIALERASSAKEAVEIIGDLLNKYQWHKQPGECINITDGNEVWIMEIYGRDIWVAFKLPDNAVFVSANRARINEINLSDEENVLYSPNLISFAVRQGWYDEKSGEPFRPAAIYCPNNTIYSTRREWRVFDLVAPSLNLSTHETEYPLYVIPDYPLTVSDIFKITGDYYEGTEYDLSAGLAGGPWGNPIRGSGFERAIGIHRTCYVQISEVKDWLPDPIKGISWFGYGHPATTYLTPLWAKMQKLPDFYQTGSRYEPFNPNSGWWINIYVQTIANLSWENVLNDIREFRDPLMTAQFIETEEIQNRAATIYKESP
ncbi:MAG: C69 family dipeptidase, partial [Deferribacterota bacterium]|nr:C69 family dipeptidase [Deferribacterota bacterium]